MALETPIANTTHTTLSRDGAGNSPFRIVIGPAIGNPLPRCIEADELPRAILPRNPYLFEYIHYLSDYIVFGQNIYSDNSCSVVQRLGNKPPNNCSCNQCRF